MPLAAELIVSEVMALNSNTLYDGHGIASDWIEIQNIGDTAADLNGYYLTDNARSLTRWRFPATSIPAGGVLVVFASGDGQIDPAGHLHTNFNLSGDGEWVGLVAPDGLTIVSQLDFPAQRNNVAFGLGQTSQLVPLLTAGGAARFRVPTAEDDGQIGVRWRGGTEGFDDASWTSVRLGIGYGEGVGGGENVAAGARVTASGPLWPGFDPGRLTDGNRSTISHPASPVSSFEYVIDLGEETSFQRIDIYNRDDQCCTDRLTNYRVTVHDDDEGSPGAPVWSADVRTNGTNSGVGGLDSMTAADDALGDFGGRYITIAKIDDGAQNYWPQIAEVEVYQAEGYDGFIQSNVQAALRGVNSSAWVRAEFDVSDTSDWAEVLLHVQYDDGFVAYINGTEVARRNAPPGEPAYDSRASATHAGSVVEAISIAPGAVRAGTNILAIHALNVSTDDPDFLLVPQLSGLRLNSATPGFLLDPTPGEFNGESVIGFLPEAQFDVPRGFYDAPINVKISAATAGAALVFTTDGSTPSRANGTMVPPASESSIAEVTVPIATTTSVRAATIRDGYADAMIVTHTYLFLEDVIHQPTRPEGMPSSWAGTPADYEMDPMVVDDPAYRDQIVAALRGIPTLSIVTDHNHLWDSREGIYINSTQRGIAWERPISLEWINGDGSTGFHVNAGIRMWGTGWAPHSASLKHSFQLKFKPQYGPSKLAFPMFPDAPVDEFDDIVLRAQGSRSWNDFRQPDIGQSQYLRDAWARDTARDMGKLEGHATFVHLYLNGIYWGLYNPVERTNESFAEEYLGGQSEDYDVINKRSGQATHATSGEMDAWNAMMDLADAGLESPAAYAAIQQYLDVDDFIDYMLIQQYATNHDGPDQGGNNTRALRRRDDQGRFTFHVWDMEYTLWYADEHRNVDGDVADSPMRLFQRLRQNEEFRLRFADHVQRHFFNNGALTAEQAAARYAARAEEIYGAIIGESARWGDARRATPYTRDVEWVVERDRLLTEYFPVRGEVLVGQLTDGGLFPRTPAPVLNRHGGQVPIGFVAQVSAPDGTVYYTLDGTDPRLPTGQVSPSAQVITPRTPLVTGAQPALWRVPTDATLEASWMDPDVAFDSRAWNPSSSKLGFDVSTPPVAIPVGLQNATATFSQARRPIANTIDGELAGPGWGFSQPVDFQGPVIRAPIAVWETAADVGFDEGTELAFTLTHDSLSRANLGRFRLSVTSDPRDTFADGLNQSGDVSANWMPLVPFEMMSAEGATFTLQPDDSILVSGGANQRDTYTIKAVTTLSKITGIRLETIHDNRLPGRAGPGRAGDGNAVLSEIQLAAAPATLHHQLPQDVSEPMATAMQNYSSLYVRVPFQVTTEQLSAFDQLRLRLQYSDGFVAYLNGQPIARQGVTGDVGFDSVASAARPRRQTLDHVEIDVTAALALLRVGENLLAIQVLNASNQEESLLMNPELLADTNLDLRMTQDVRFRGRTLNAGEWSALAAADFHPLGDLTGDGTVDQQDILRLCQAIDQSDHRFDLNGDAVVDHDDLDFLVTDVLRTTYGDANLDGRFNSSDLVSVFQVGEYEDGLARNSTWSEGDWNCDGDFTTADLVVAFQAGGYEQAALRAHDAVFSRLDSGASDNGR